MSSKGPPASAVSADPQDEVLAFEPRRVLCNNAEENNKFKYANNYITTSKYTIINFLPKNFFLQFMRIANFYFLCIACLQLVPKLSPISYWSSITPLIFVLSVTAIKEAIEDVRRHKSDKDINNRRARVLRNQDFQNALWQDVTVGDILMVSAEEPFPADLILLASSEPNGICYIETAQLDGETNLKIRTSLVETGNLRTPIELMMFKGIVECEQPNNSLYTFEGSLQINQSKYPISVNQVLLRGCTLRNTEWVYALVIFTGVDTKLMRNSTEATPKRSHIERIMNTQVVSIFTFQIILSGFCSLMSGLWISSYAAGAWYLNEDLNPDQAISLGILSFPTFIILFNVMIPISLYVSAEMVKLAQAFLIQQDLDMYHEDTNTPAVARTSNLNEELGQVEYIFTDKTGTLTCNQMEFMRCSIGGIAYGSASPDDDEENAKAAEERKAQAGIACLRFKDPRLISNLVSHDKHGEQLREFFSHLALCHTVIPEKDRHNAEKVIYQAASPDEGALVFAARATGFEFKSRTPDAISISALGREVRYEVLNVLEFTSARKRMSVILRSPTGRIQLLCKGADSVLFPLMKHTSPFVSETMVHLKDFASQGLRTLVLAKATLDPKEYYEWNKIFYAASISLENRDTKLAAAAELIEKNLELVGASAIEDRLQDGVPATIKMLRQAGCKVWMLTGDKQETAINVGIACSLLSTSMPLILLDSNSPKETIGQIEHALSFYGSSKEDLGLVVEGGPLRHALEDDTDVSMQLLKLARMCSSVICCRVSPLQKAMVVKLIKDNVHNVVTLAIGDGANDVGMIQSAHIGVGISGQEGMQAVMCSDYAIAQFRFLQRLILVHGRWAYNRVSKLIVYSFYKNFTFALCQFWFAFQSGFSGVTVFDSGPYATYNVFFTSLPIIVLAIFDQDVPPQRVLENPALFQAGIHNKLFNRKLFLVWLFQGVYHSVICFHCPLLVFTVPTTSALGTNEDGIWELGMVVYTCIIIVVNLKVALETTYWTWLNHLVVWGSITAWLLFSILFSLMYSMIGFMPNVHMIMFKLFSSSAFYCTVFLTVSMALTPDFLLKYVQRTFYPEAFQLVQEMEKAERLRERGVDVEKGGFFDGLDGMKRKFGYNLKNLQKKHSGYAMSAPEAGQVSANTRWFREARSPSKVMPGGEESDSDGESHGAEGKDRGLGWEGPAADRSHSLKILPGKAGDGLARLSPSSASMAAKGPIRSVKKKIIPTGSSSSGFESGVNFPGARLSMARKDKEPPDEDKGSPQRLAQRSASQPNADQ